MQGRFFQPAFWRRLASGISGLTCSWYGQSESWCCRQGCRRLWCVSYWSVERSIICVTCWPCSDVSVGTIESGSRGTWKGGRSRDMQWSVRQAITALHTSLPCSLHGTRLNLARDPGLDFTVSHPPPPQLSTIHTPPGLAPALDLA